MNIYITKANEEWLRKQEGSMSGLINQLIINRRNGDKIINRDFKFNENITFTEWVPSAKDKEWAYNWIKF